MKCMINRSLFDIWLFRSTFIAFFYLIPSDKTFKGEFSSIILFTASFMVKTFFRF